MHLVNTYTISCVPKKQPLLSNTNSTNHLFWSWSKSAIKLHNVLATVQQLWGPILRQCLVACLSHCLWEGGRGVYVTENPDKTLTILLILRPTCTSNKPQKLSQEFPFSLLHGRDQTGVANSHTADIVNWWWVKVRVRRSTVTDKCKTQLW